MYVEVSGGSAGVREAEVLTSLSVRVIGGLGDEAVAAALAGLGRLDGTHAWLDVAALRRSAMSQVDEGALAEWARGFEAMIAFATTKGWVADGAVRAHLERSPS